MHFLRKEAVRGEYVNSLMGREIAHLLRACVHGLLRPTRDVLERLDDFLMPFDGDIGSLGVQSCMESRAPFGGPDVFLDALALLRQRLGEKSHFGIGDGTLRRTLLREIHPCRAGAP